MVRLVQPARVEKVKGIVKSLKDSFGFIERADIMQDVSTEREREREREREQVCGIGSNLMLVPLPTDLLSQQ